MLKEFREHFLAVLTLIVFSLAVYDLVRLAANGGASASSTGPQQNCCPNDQDKPHLLVGTYYKTDDELHAKLLLNNKGPQPLEAHATLVSMSGERFVPAPVIIEAESFRMIDMQDWVTAAGPQFSEGSIQVFHRGPDLILGAQIYLVDEQRSLSFDEKLVETKTFKSSKFEGLWWLPSQIGEVRLALSNTSDAPLTVTANVEGHRPERAGNATIELAPHQTRLLNVRDDLMHHEHGAMSRYGSISLQHSGAPGALLARAMAQDVSQGYSLSMQFSDPKAAKSSKTQGVGLRLGGIAGQSLTPVVIARNVADKTTTVTGRLPYTTSDGSAGAIALPNLELDAGEMALIDVAGALRRHSHQASAAIGALEFEYTTAPGSVIITALSVTDDGNQQFRVPMWDIHALRSSTGGYPWYIDGNSSTVVYIKNGAAHRQQYFLHIKYLGGSYTIGSKTIEGGQTVTYDLRKLRDEQIPDNQGRVIPPDAVSGQLHWSKVGGESGVLIGRSEQADNQLGISSNYACLNCCNDNPDLNDFRVLPNPASAFVGESETFTASVLMDSCYGNDYYINVQDAIWSSSDHSVASVADGLVFAQSPGTTNIGAQWYTTRYAPYAPGGEFGGSGECAEFPAMLHAIPAALTVKAPPRIDDITPGLGPVDSSVGISIVGSGFGNNPTVNVAGGGITANIQSSSETSISVTLNISANASPGNHGITVTANGQQSNSLSFFVQIPTKLQRDSMSGLQNEGGCGAIRNLSYTLLDQHGDPINANGTVSEGISNFTGPGDVRPPSETQRSMAQGSFPDVVGYDIATCPPPFTATFTQSFVILLNTPGYAWALSSQNSVSMGRTSAGAKFVDITFSP